MGKIITNLFYGLKKGAALAVVLYALGVVVELCNAAFAIITSNFDAPDILPFMWSWDAFGKCILVTTVVGGIIGGIHGALLDAQERNAKIAEWNRKNSEQAAAHRKNNLETLKKEVQKLLTSVYIKQNQVNNYILDTSYVGNERQKEGWTALKVAYDTNAELQAIVEEILE